MNARPTHCRTNSPDSRVILTSAGMLSRKAGVSHFHVGNGKGRLHLLRQLLDEFETPPESLYPTHVERSEKLMDEAIELTRRGCFVDIDTVNEDLQKWLTYYFEHDGDPAQLTLSSDASISSPANILSQIRECVRNSDFELAQLLPLVTENTAQVLETERSRETRTADEGGCAGARA